MISPTVRVELEKALGEGVAFDVPMARYTSLRVGGPADALATPADRDELAQLLAICAEHGVAHGVIGSGFNTLVLDGGLEGVIIHLKRFRGLERLPDGELRAEAGVSHSQITRMCTREGLTGLEFAAGIPGSVGGWIAMNAGVPEREMVDVVREVEVVSPDGGERRFVPAEVLEFVYRAMRGLTPGSVIVSALLAVEPADAERVRDEVDRHLAHRSLTQPINVPSCGSVFRNPEGDHAGRLIEDAGLKGASVGGAQISEVHANFIANTGGARAADFLALIERARDEVEARSGIRLEPEVKIVGRPE